MHCKIFIPHFLKNVKAQLDYFPFDCSTQSNIAKMSLLNNIHLRLIYFSYSSYFIVTLQQASFRKSNKPNKKRNSINDKSDCMSIRELI